MSQHGTDGKCALSTSSPGNRSEGTPSAGTQQEDRGANRLPVGPRTLRIRSPLQTPRSAVSNPFQVTIEGSALASAASPFQLTDPALLVTKCFQTKAPS